MSYDYSGASVAAGLNWDQIHDPMKLKDHSPELKQYWTQIDHIIHEFEHAFGAGLGEYYRLAVVGDKTDVEPSLEIRLGKDDSYWSQNADYFTDPLLLNIWNNPLADSPTAYADLLAKVDFAPVTAAVMNCPARFNLAETVHDLSRALVRVVADDTGEPIAGARVYTWNTRTRSYSSEAELSDAITGTDGMVEFPWSCCQNAGACASCFNSQAKLIKVFADGHHAAVRLFSIFDAQKSKLGRPPVRARDRDASGDDSRRRRGSHSYRDRDGELTRLWWPISSAFCKTGRWPISVATNRLQDLRNDHRGLEDEIANLLVAVIALAVANLILVRH